MAKAILLAGFLSIATIASAQAESLYCATMIALGRYDVPHTIIAQMRLEIGLDWSRVTGEELGAENLDKIIVACTDDPGKSIAEVVKMLVAKDRSTGHKFALDNH